MIQGRRCFQIGRRIYEATHVLNKDVTRGLSTTIVPKGTPVYLMTSRHEGNGKWSVLLISSILDKEAQSYLFSTDWVNLSKL